MGQVVPQRGPQGPGSPGQDANIQPTQEDSGGRRPGTPLLRTVLRPS